MPYGHPSPFDQEMRNYQTRMLALLAQRPPGTVLIPDRGYIQPTRNRRFIARAIIKFPGEQKYIRVTETVAPHRVLANAAKRDYYMLHYGPYVAEDPSGEPKHDPNLVIIRICSHLTGGGLKPRVWPHLHLYQRDPRHGQDSLNGPALDTIMLFDFIHAVFRSRQGAGNIETLLGISLKQGMP